MLIEQLQPIYKYLKRSGYAVSMPSANILEVSADKDSLPFCVLVIEPTDLYSVLVSYACDFPDVQTASRLVIDLMHFAKVKLAEAFFIDSNGEVYWGPDANFRYELSAMWDLNELSPISEALN